MTTAREYESGMLRSLESLARRMRLLAEGMNNLGHPTIINELAEDLEAILRASNVAWDRIEALGEKIAAQEELRWKRAEERAHEVVMSFIGLIRAAGRDVPPAETYARMVKEIADAICEAERDLDSHRPIIVHALERLLASHADDDESDAAGSALAAMK